jgi:rod shape-determining protein MreD
MVKEFFLFFALGLSLLVVQSTWLYGEVINPFRIDLLFILIIFLGTLNRLSLALILGALLGMMVDILSWGGMGKAMILYPLIVWIYHLVWTRSIIQSIFFMVVSVLLLQILYGFTVYFFLTLSQGMEFTRYQYFLIMVQAVITMLLSLPLFYLFKTFFEKKPSLR